jgi:4-carboxymuconolactone decarboxylase
VTSSTLDVRRHRLISIDYITTLRCHGSGRATRRLREPVESGMAGLNKSDGCRPPQPKFLVLQTRPTAQPFRFSLPSAARKLIGDFDPKLAELTDNVLFADVWERPGLSKRDRSLITVAALIALNRPEQLRAHIRLARENGVTKDEIVEVIMHLAFYAGWPNAINAVAIARETFK